MALIGNNADTLLTGLSGFWHRFFRDIGDIQATYEGTEILLGQVYLNFLSDVLNTSIVETPLFRKEYYKLLTFREDQLVYKEHGDNVATPPALSFYGNPGTDRYVFTSDTFFGSIPQLQDVIFSPRTSLTEGVDYKVAGAEIQFKVDPTDPVLAGYARRRVTIGIGGQFTSASIADWSAVGVEKGDTLYYSEALEFHPAGPLANIDATWFSQYANARKVTVVHIDGNKLSVSSDTPFPTFPEGAQPSGFSWRIVRQRDDLLYNQNLPVAPNTPTTIFTDGQILYTKTLEVNETSMWAVDAKVDDLAIYNTYGYFFTNKQLSTEVYRSLIRGLMQLYILGPAMARLESALNLTASLPTIFLEGEILQSYDSGVLAAGTDGLISGANIFQTASAIFSINSVGGFIRISESNFATNIGTFNIVAYVSPTSVKLSQSTVFGVSPLDLMSWTYTQKNKQTITTDQNTYSYPLATPIRADVTNPTNNGILKFQAFEALTTALRVTDYVQDPEWWHTITVPQELMPDTPPARRVVTAQLYPNIIGPVGNAYVGDPGFYVGADENENIVPAPYRHNAAFILMDRFLKLHIFGVLIDSSVSLTGLLVNDLQQILKDVKPAHTALYFRPLTSFRDVVDLSDELAIAAVLRYAESLGIIPNQLTVGSSWLIGDTWQYAGPVGGAITIGTGAGFIPVAVGGTDPLVQPTDPTNTPPGTQPDLNWIDRPLYVYMHS
jgi:hypothetical protein